MNVVNIAEKFSLFSDQWSPKKVGELNGQQVLLAKIQGEFIWHTHEDEDELFYIIKGELAIHMEEKTVTVKEGEFFIVPKGVAHKPIAQEEVHVLLFEPLSTKHTGDIIADVTVQTFESI